MAIIKSVNRDRQFFHEDSGKYLIPVAHLAKLFFQIQYTLYNKYHLKILNNFSQRTGIIEIIRTITDCPNDSRAFTIPLENIPDNTVNDTIGLMNRHVIFLLRKDLQIYDFYDENGTLIDVPYAVNETEFRALMNNSRQYYIGIDGLFGEYLNTAYPIVLYSVVGSLAIFLERLNLAPRIFEKILDTLGEYNGSRQITGGMKARLFDYNSTCFYCSRKLELNDEYHADHFIPYSYVFDSPIWNMVPACRDCNLKKSDNLVGEEFLEKLFERNADPGFSTEFEREFEGETVDAINEKLRVIYQQCAMFFTIKDLT